MNLHHKIKQNIRSHKNEYITFLQQLIQEPSTTGKELGAQNLMSDRLKAKGLDVDVWDPDFKELIKSDFFNPLRDNYDGSPNVVGVLKGTENGRSVMLNGHIDEIGRAHV